MSASQYRRSCDEPALCQGRVPPCATCSQRAGTAHPAHDHPTPTHPFAPGAIERHTRSRQQADLGRWLRRTAGVLAASALAGLLAGLAVGTARAQVAAPVADPAEQRPALLPTHLGLHLRSVHTRNPCAQGGNGAATNAATGTACLGWNNANHGLYARWANGLTVGALRNSLNRTSAYVAGTWESPRINLGGMAVSAAATAGVMSGYDRRVRDDYTGHPGDVGKGQHTAVRCNAAGHCRTVLLRSVLVPLLAPSVAVHITPTTTARLSWMHKHGADADPAIHLSVEFKLP